MKSMLDVIRWLVLLPAAVLAGVLASSLFVLVNSSACTGGRFDPENSLEQNLLVQVASGLIRGAVHVLAGSYIAPRGRTAVALTLTVLHVFISGAASFHALVVTHRYIDVVSLVAGVGGAVWAALQVREEARKAEKQPSERPR